MELIDLRSDTVTRPDAGMRAAMAAAEVGDDVYGEDPTVNRLQQHVAGLLGKEAALWVPTGTMGNQLALGTLAGPGDEVIAHRGSHVVNYEGAGVAALWGAQALVVDGPRGTFGPDELRAVLRGSDDVHFPRQRAVSLENTSNRGGGSLWPRALFEAVAQAAREAGLAVHLDGARLWNAHVASGVPLRELCASADTVMVALSKGLGAPAGSLVASTADRVRHMRRLRKRLGGGLRQAGILAAAGLYGLEHNLQRLADDHRNARALAEGLRDVPGLRCDPAEVETNIVLVDVTLPGGGPAFAAAAKARGVLFNAVSRSRIRLVTHLDVPSRSIPHTLGRLRDAAVAAQ